MKIRHKLTLYFSIASSLIIIAFGLGVNYFSAQYRQNEFFERLKTRVDIAEKFFLERETFTDEDYELIRAQFLQSLPDETEEVAQIAPGWQDGLTNSYPSEFLQSLESLEEAFFYTKSVQGAGRVFHLKEGNYAVIITAVDKVGIRMLGNLRSIILLGIITGIVVTSVLGYYLSRHLIRPITLKARQANTMSVSNLHERLNVYNPDDELGELTIAFNNLLDRLEGAFNVQKLFVANASHEIRNPLTVILGEAEVALDKERSAKEYQDALKSISHEAERLNLLVNNLLQLSTVSYNQAGIKREDIKLVRLLTESKQKYDLLEPSNQIRFVGDLSGFEGLLIYGNSNLLQTALINIFDNASKFSAHALVQVSVEVKDDVLVLSVKDKGVGIPPDDIPNITQPFFRAENVRQIRGTGIGIPLTLRIVELHQGKLDVESALGQGTTVTVTLPIVGS